MKKAHTRRETCWRWFPLTLFLLFALTVKAQPTIQTDKLDYLPGETVLITGTGWLPFEEVRLTIEHLVFDHPDEVLYAFADADGDVSNNDYVIQEWDFGETFLLTATGLTSNLEATAEFTDAAGTISKVYQHWADGDAPNPIPDWNNNILSDNKSDYFEGEVIPHVYVFKAPLTNGQSYSFNVTYNYYQQNTNAGGFAYMTTYNLSREPGPLNATDPYITPTIDDSFGNGGGMQGAFYTVDADITNVSAVTYLGTGTKDGYVTITFTYDGETTTNGIAEIYFGLYIAEPEQVPDQGLGVTNGASAWTGGSLQTTVDIGGSGATSIQLSPAAIIRGEISGHKFNDLNNNGAWDSGEPALSGWTIQLYRDDGTVLDSDVTDANGYFFFSVIPDADKSDPDNDPYYVREVEDQEGWTRTLPSSGFYGPMIISADPAIGQTAYTDRDFGNYYCQAPELYNDALTVCENIPGGELDGTFNLTTADVGIDESMTVIYSVGETIISTEGLTSFDATDGTVVNVKAYYSSPGDPSCYGQATITLNVEPRPVLTYASLTVCENTPGEGIGTFDLTSALTGVDPEQMTIEYSVADVPVAAPADYDAENGDLITVMAYYTDNTLICPEWVMITLYVEPRPVLTNASLTVCENIPGEGVGTFDLTTALTGVVPAEMDIEYSDAGGIIASPASYDAEDGDLVTVTAFFNDYSLDCETSATITLNVNPRPVLYNASDAFCDIDQSNTILAGYNSAIGATEGQTVVWYTDVDRTPGNEITETGDLPPTLSPSPTPYYYYARVTTGDGCDADAMLTITINPSPALTVEDLTLCSTEEGGNTAVFALEDAITGITFPSGTAEFLSSLKGIISSTQENLDNYQGTNGEQITITLTTLENCQASATFTLHVNPRPVVSVTDLTECTTDEGGNTALFDLTSAVTFDIGTAEYASGETVIETPGAYFGTHEEVITVTVTSNKGCVSEKTFSLKLNPPLNISVDPKAICEGETVTLTANPSGGNGNYSFEWSTGETAQSINVNPFVTTTFEVSVFDDFVSSTGAICSASTDVTVTVNPELFVSVASKAICEGETVTLTANASGGNGNYSYEWSTGAKTQSIDVSPVETMLYTVTVSDDFVSSNGTICSAFTDATVTVNPALNVSLDPKAICEGETVTLTAVASGGTGTYSYLWNTGATSPDISVAPAETTTYWVTVSDDFVSSNGTTCSASNNATVTVNPALTVCLEPKAICEGETVTLTAFASGGTGNFSYLWNTGEISQSIEVAPFITTVYSVTVYDDFVSSNGTICSVSIEETVTVNPELFVSVASQAICKGETATLTAIPFGGNGNYSFEWSTGETTQSIYVAPEETSTYTVTVSDDFVSSKGTTCSAFTDATVTVNPELTVSIEDLAVCYGEFATLFATPGGGTGSGYTYVWLVDGEIQEELEGSIITLYGLIETTEVTVILSDDFVPTQGETPCTATDDATITVNPELTVNIEDQAVCYGEDVTFTAQASGGTGNYTYYWMVDETGYGPYSENTLTLYGVTQNADITVYLTDDFVVNRDGSSIKAAFYGCYAEDQATLTINPRPEVTVEDLTECSTEEGGNTALFDLTAEVTFDIGTPVYSSGETVIATPAAYDGTDGEVITVTVTSSEGCVTVETFTLNVNPLPGLTVTDLTLCSTEEGGNTAVFALEDAITGITFPSGTAEFLSSLNGIILPTQENLDNYQGTNGEQITITLTTIQNCVASATFTLYVDPRPILTVEDLTECSTDEGGDEAEFDLAGAIVTLTGGTAKYYTGDPLAEITGTAISAYVGTDGQVITVVATSAEECETTETFTLYVDPRPVLTVQDLTECSTGEGGTTSVFDILSNVSATGGNLAFVSNINGPLNLTDMNAYTGTNGEIITVSSTSPPPAFCQTIKSLTLTVDPRPVLTVESLTECSTDEGGDEAEFDLAGAIVTLTGGTVKYFTGDPLVEITNISAYIGADGQVITVVATSAEDCETTETFTLNVDPRPILQDAYATYCEDEGVLASFNPDDYNAGILAEGQDISDFTFKWTGGPLNEPGSVSLPAVTTFNVVVTNISTGCFSEAQLEITINPCSWLNLKKTTNQAVDPTLNWTFVLYEGSFGDLYQLASESTLGVPDGVLFGDAGPLSRNNTYTVCELGVPAGYGTTWMIDSDGDLVFELIPYTTTPGTAGVYNPNSVDVPPQDLGNRCFEIAGSLLPANTYEPPTSLALQLEVDNTFPGGDARTPGYWKNWNTCTGGGQQYTATENADDWDGIEGISAYDRVYSGWALLDDIIELFGISWGDFVLDNCIDAQFILDNRDLDGVNRASDPAYNLAKHLLAYQLNQGAGAYICPDLIAIETEAVNLLIAIGFNGTGNYLNKPKTPLQKQQASRALELGAILDAYNNNEGCEEYTPPPPPPPPEVTPLSCTTTVTHINKKNPVGKVVVNAVGGTSPYLYKMGDGSYQTSNEFPITVAGTYTFTVKDGSSPEQTCTCTATVNSTIKSGETIAGPGVLDALSAVRFYPNPFSDKITFEFLATEDAHARLEIINLTGQRVAMLIDGPVEQGVTYQAEFNPRNLISQILIYRLIVSNTVQSGRIIYQK